MVMTSKTKRARSPEPQESLESLFAAAGLGEAPLCRALKRLQTRSPSPNVYSRLQVGVQALDEEESSVSSQGPSLQSRRAPGIVQDRGPAMSSDSRSTAPGSVGHRKRYAVRRRQLPVDCDIDSSTDSESDASVTPWRLPGPSAGNSAANSGYSGAHLQSQSYADSATSQRYLLPRFTISTRSTNGEPAASHPLLQPQPLRPHTSQFQPSQAISGSNFPSSSTGANPNTWSNVPMFRNERGACYEADVAGRLVDRGAGELPEVERQAQSTVLSAHSRHNLGAAANPRHFRPRGLHHEEDDDEEEDRAALGRHRTNANAHQGHEQVGSPGRAPTDRRFPGVAPLLANVGFDVLMNELPGRLERIQVAGEQGGGARDPGGEVEDGVGGMQVPEGDIAQPQTPTRNEECPTPRGARAAGNRSSQRGEISYESLYEETNTLLKNLHFERVKRLGHSAVAWKVE
eukprot:jgi/Botrbrau1/17494/Bobra.0054s0076.1